MAKQRTKHSPRPRVVQVDPPVGDGARGKDRLVDLRMTKRQGALLLAEHDSTGEDWDVLPVDLRAIAAEVGCSYQNLYKDPKLKKFRKRHKRVPAVGGSKGRVIRKPIEQDGPRCRDG